MDDTPRDWLARPAAKQPVLPAAAAAPPQPTRLPDSLEALQQWMLDPANCAELGTRRIFPIGTAAAGLMVISDFPDPEDFDSGALATGVIGRLLDGMLAAIGRDRASVYLTSLAPGRPAGGRLTSALQDDLAKLARHHIDMVQPRAVLLIGESTTRALIGSDFARARRKTHNLNAGDRIVPAIVTFHPRFLLQNPGCKADAWADLRLLLEAFSL